MLIRCVSKLISADDNARLLFRAAFLQEKCSGKRNRQRKDAQGRNNILSHAGRRRAWQQAERDQSDGCFFVRI